jgi:signal transduction histidine kinase/ligand-binding sensor domain-containing protein
MNDPVQTVARRAFLWLGVLLIVSVAAPSLHGRTGPSPNWQVGHDYWTSRDGAPGDIQALAQTNDGFLWIGSPSGLFRFDGTRFERFTPLVGDSLLSTNVMCLLAPPSGGLWIGYTFGGFSFLDNGRVTNYALDVPVRYLARSRNGVVWAATSAGLWKFEAARWQPVGVDWNAPTGAVLQIAFDAEGTLWVLAGVDWDNMDLLFLNADTTQFRTAAKNLHVLGFTLNAAGEVITQPEPGALISSAVHLSAWPVLRKDSHQIVDRNNSVWMAPRTPAVVVRLSSRDGPRDALAKASPDTQETWRFSPFPFAKLIDREGNIWFGEIRGLHRFWYDPFNKVALPKAAADNVSFALAPDEQGRVWMSVGGWYSSSVLLHTSGGTPEYPPLQAQIRAPFAHRALDGAFWFIGNGCLLHLVGRKLVRVALPPEIASQALYLQAITEEQRGAMWVSFLRYGLYRLADGAWTRDGGHHELPQTNVLAEFTDGLGRVWLGYVKNQLALVDGDHVQLFGSGDGLRLGNITAIHGRGAGIWIGGEFGLVRFDNGRFQNMIAVNDEWLRGISGIVETRDGDLWLNGLSGILHISHAEVSEASRNTSYRLKGEHFGRRHGLPGVPTQLHPLPTAIEGTDGRLWFALQNGVVWLDPATYSEHHVRPPAITIESVSADDTGYAPGPSLSFPARTSSVQINYAAVSLSDPEAIRFRYQLQDTDSGWHETTTSNPAVYRNLAPGTYRFTVAASDTDGVWSDNVASAAFTILPAWYQTAWFRLLCVATGVVAAWALYHRRMRQVAQALSARFDERLAERTRVARDIHDTLLQTVQGSKMVADDALDRPEDVVGMRRAMEELSVWLGQAAREGRETVKTLRTSTTQRNDLAQAFQRAIEDCRRNGSMQTSLSVIGDAREMHPIVRDEVYRIGYEAIRNACSHSRGSRLEVGLSYAQDLTVRVADNGVGIDPAIVDEGKEGHFGLPGLRERAARIGAKLTLVSSSDSGTDITLTVPGRVVFHKTITTWSERMRAMVTPAARTPHGGRGEHSEDV